MKQLGIHLSCAWNIHAHKGPKHDTKFSFVGHEMITHAIETSFLHSSNTSMCID